MGTFTNSEDPDEMPHNVALHPGLHCLLKEKKKNRGPEGPEALT